MFCSVLLSFNYENNMVVASSYTYLKLVHVVVQLMSQIKRYIFLKCVGRSMLNRVRVMAFLKAGRESYNKQREKKREPYIREHIGFKETF